FASAVRGYHVCKDVWKPSIGEKLVAKREFNNPMDKHAVKVVKDDETVGHLPHEFSRIAWYFLARSGEISVEVIGRRRHCKQLCGGMQIPCQLECKQTAPLGATTSTESNDQRQVSIFQFVTPTSLFTPFESNGLVYKPHPRFFTQNFGKKVRLIHE
ncbi:unnamed protein product, partial [Porites lobata]